ncbi:D-serine ammonia-lyase [Bacillus sp. FJAT-44742]|uniref:D-serine ammonia-lyase n=1 Tax=Bacillus sp. FJAT-44742 TaxID=2014005 RepID=UPI000C24C6AB|nr:D-serine ammonia-lyase [Bacillus sp. FJAT-44742]
MNQSELQFYIEKYPVFQTILDAKEVYWTNPNYEPYASLPVQGLDESIIYEAAKRFKRFEPLMAKAFPDSSPNGIISSSLEEIPQMKASLEQDTGESIKGRLFLKCDNELPVAGSIKARGGFHEIFTWAEELALKEGILTSKEDDYSKLLHEESRKIFSRYSIAVGSTGNLGLSIGIMSAELGFTVDVHMSQDAKEWKKELLREKGVNVHEYETDYSAAVAQGRKQCEADPRCHFVDDEHSVHLFAGYSAAALEVKEQLEELGMTISKEQPLYVYLPCGVGGGPGGVAYGLKHVFGEHVHCYFAEPVQSPCMLLGLLTGKHADISVQDVGLDNITEADGLAVGTPSSFVGKVMDPLLSGIYTIRDDVLYHYLRMLMDTEGTYLEPSALAGMAGPYRTNNQGEKDAVHVVWGTGGSLVPEEVRTDGYEKGKKS